MGAAYRQLSEASSRTGFTDEYLLHINARTETAPMMHAMMQVKAPRRWKFEVYKKEQCAVKNLAKDLLGGLRPYNTIIVWGNGGFAPSGRGHAMVPIEKLQLLLPKSIFCLSSDRKKARPRPARVTTTKSERFHSRNKPLVAP